MLSWLNNKKVAALVAAVIITGAGTYQVSLWQKSETVSQSYLIQGASLEKMVALVNEHGGTVSHELPIINAIGAVLTEQQASTLTQLDQLSVMTDRQLRTLSDSSSTESTDVQSETDTSTDTDEHQEEQVKQRRAIDTYIAEQTGADDLHDMGITGKGIAVAVVDSGISFGGKAGRFLRFDTDGNKRVVAAYNARSGKLNPRKNMDQNGHGSHVAGVAVSSVKARGGNYNGVAPDADLVSVKAFDKEGNGTYLDVIRGLDWILENRRRYNIRVVNLSFGAEAQSYYWQDPLNQAAMKLWEAGVVVVTSAGNTGGEEMSITVPGNLPYVITVGAATDSFTPYDYSDDKMTTFSAQGPTVEGFVKPDLVSWGGHVLSKINAVKASQIGQWYPANDKGRDYFEITGTSQASAVITGTVALMLQAEPYLTPDDVKCRLVASAKPAQSSDGMLAYSPFRQGAGLSNAWDAVHNTEMGCANQGLDISADLNDLEHYQGPTRVDENGELYLIGPDGAVWSEGTRWNTFDTQGTRWNTFGIEGTRWNTFGIEGTRWNTFSVEGTRWNTLQVWSEGTRWNTVSAEGTRWNTFATEGTRWNTFVVESMSTRKWVAPE